jgi:hypothetical protein
MSACATYKLGQLSGVDELNPAVRAQKNGVLGTVHTDSSWAPYSSF